MPVTNLVEVTKVVGQIREMMKTESRLRSSAVPPRALGCGLWPEQSLFIFLLRVWGK